MSPVPGLHAVGRRWAVDLLIHSPAVELARLRACLQALLEVLARPSVWADGAAPADVHAVLDLIPELVDRIAEKANPPAANSPSTQETEERREAGEAQRERESRAFVDTIPGLLAI